MAQVPKFISVLLPWAGYHIFDSFTAPNTLSPATSQQDYSISFMCFAWFFSYSHNSFRISVFTSSFRGTFELHLFLPWHTGSFIWHGCHLMKTNEVASSILVFASSTIFDSSMRTCQTQFCFECTINVSAVLKKMFLFYFIFLKRIHTAKLRFLVLFSLVCL